MGKAARIKKERAKLSAQPNLMDPKLIEAYNRGRAMGCKIQREADIEQLVKVLEGLEDVPGIGDKTAWKVREFFLQQFGTDKH